MDEYLSIRLSKRPAITQKIKQVLFRKKEIVFAFLFGSFLEAPAFKDIDIGVYVKGIKSGKVFDYELELSKELAEKSGLSFDRIDVKILNSAPISFLNNVFSRGQLLFSKDQELLSNLIENSSLEAIANEYLAHQSLKELIPA